LVHAAGESSPGNIPSGTHAVVLGVKEELDLVKLEQKLKNNNIPHVSIREPDLGWNNQLMAIGLSPTYKTPIIKKLLSSYGLLK
jgi:hypothetical protein